MAEARKQGVNIMFISYWSLNEPLTSSTILPYMTLLEEDPNISSVLFVTVEHDKKGIKPDLTPYPKLTHFPIEFDSYPAGRLEKAKIFLSAPKVLAQKAKENNIHVIDSKASIAGLLAYKVSRLTGLPFYVESFEPHSEYMRQSGSWKAWDPYYIYNKFYERKQVKHADRIITVTKNYKDYLSEKGVDPDRIIVVPSVTELEKFKPDQELRTEYRKKLGLSNDTILGIYVGKFGGMYLRDQAFDLMAFTRERFKGKYHQLVLTPQSPEEITSEFRKRGFTEDELTVQLAAHEDVPKFLASADLAFTPFNQMRVGAFLSPVKNGEYWAMGLPVLLTNGISDDHWIIRDSKKGGALFNVNERSMKDAIDKVAEQLKEPDRAQKIRQLAIEYRSIDIARKVYKDIFAPEQFGLQSIG